MAKIYKRGDTKSKFWYYRIQVRDPKTQKLQEFRGSTSETERRNAENYAAKLEERLRKQIYDKEKPTKELVLAWGEFLDQRIRQLDSRFTYIHIYDLLIEEFGLNALVADMNLNGLNNIKAKKFAQGITASSWNRYLANFKTFHTFCAKRYLTEEIDFSDLRERQEPAKTVYFTRAEVDRLLNCAMNLEVRDYIKVGNEQVPNNHLYKFLLLAFFTGQRQSTILNIKVDHFDFENKTLKFPKIKGNKSHAAPLFPQLYNVAMQMCEEANDEGYLIHYKGKNVLSVKKSFDSLLAKAQIEVPKNHKIHIVRHTAASLIYAATNDLYMVKEILGHSDIKMTMIYTHLMDNKKMKEMQEVFSNIRFIK